VMGHRRRLIESEYTFSNVPSRNDGAREKLRLEQLHLAETEAEN